MKTQCKEAIGHFSKLINILSKQKRYADIEKVTEDAAYRDKLMKEYKLPVSEYPDNSVRIVLWTCPICHGDYQYRICDRELDDKSCPYCCDKKILPEYNSFKVRHPEEMEEWDELANFLLVDQTIF